MSAQTFFPFPKLPTEIRIKIWQLADRHSPSIIRLNFCVFTASAEERQPASSTLHACSHHYDHIFIPPQAVPSRLHICHESRSLALPQYTRGFPVTLEADMGKIPKFRSQGHFEEPERTDKTPCVHEQSVMLQNKEMYWNPSFDVVVWQRHAEMDAGATLWNSKKMAYLWICHPEHLSLVMKNAKNVAIPFYMFRDWLELSDIGHTQNPEVVYFLLERRPSDNDEFWEGQVNWYSEWMGKVLQQAREQYDRELGHGNAATLGLEKLQLKLVGCKSGKELSWHDISGAIPWVKDETGDYKFQQRECGV